MSLENKISELIVALEKNTAALGGVPEKNSKPAKVVAPTPVLVTTPVVAPVTPAVVTTPMPVAPFVGLTPEVPRFPSVTEFTRYMIESFTTMTPEKQSEIQKPLSKRGYQNLAAVAPADYDAIYAEIEAIKLA